MGEEGILTGTSGAHPVPVMCPLIWTATCSIEEKASLSRLPWSGVHVELSSNENPPIRVCMWCRCEMRKEE